MVNRKADKREKIVTDEYIVAAIRSLLANMCGEQDRVHEMRSPIDYRDLPEDLPFEAKLMRLYSEFSENGIPPTRENLLMGFKTILGIDEKDCVANLDFILEKATPDRSVRTLSL